MTTYFVVDYDNEASGPFVELGSNVTWAGGGVGFLITLIDRGTTGKLYMALLAGAIPTDGQTMTQGSTTADPNGDGAEIAYSAYCRRDLEIAGNGDIALDAAAAALGTTHSFKFDGQTGNCIVGDILTFSPGGQEAELIEVESDVGASGEYNVRFITNIDEYGLPADNATFSNGGTGDGAVDGAVHPRVYTPLELHRMLQDLNDDEDISGDDDLSRIDPTASERSTDEIIDLLGNVNVSDDVIKRMYGGSLTQEGGDVLISGLDVQVTSPEGDTQPVIIQNDTIITDYWKNAYMPDSIAGNVRIMLKTRVDGVDIDGRRVKGKLLEFNNIYFIGATTLGTATTALALFSSTDGNNQTAVGTVAGAPYNTIVLTEGYQTEDYNNGNGPTPFGLIIDFGSASSLQCYERTKYIQRRGTAETLFGRNAQYFDGINLNFAYDNLTGAFSEDEVVAWGTVVTFTGQSTNFTVGEVVEFDTAGTPTWGRILYMYDAGATGTLVMDMGGNPLPGTGKSMLGLDSGGDGTTNTVGTNTAAGTGHLIADDTTGDNLYLCRLTGVLPVNNSEIYGLTSDADCLVDGTPQTRTINNQFVGVYTGSNYQTNHGIGIDSTDAIVGDKFPNLLGVVQEPPNNQQGQVTGLKHYDTVMCYPWDGTSYDVNGDAEPDFDEMQLSVALTGGVSTVVNVGTGNIPDNTPASGFLRIERNSDGNMDLVEYASHDGDDEFTLVGTAPSDASIGNDVMRALLDEEMTADGTASYTAVKGATSTQVTITVKNGYTAVRNGPLKVSKATATFGATGFSVPASRISDA
jgi:hypothetical protein